MFRTTIQPYPDKPVLELLQKGLALDPAKNCDEDDDLLDLKKSPRTISQSSLANQLMVNDLFLNYLTMRILYLADDLVRAPHFLNIVQLKKLRENANQAVFDLIFFRTYALTA